MKRKGRIYPGEIIDTFEKDEKVGKANKFEGLEKLFIQCFQKFHFKRKNFFFQRACVGYLCFCFQCYLNSKSCKLTQSVQFSSVAQLCPTLFDPMNCSSPGLPVHHQLLKFTQTHVHWVGDAIQPSHLLSSPSPLGPNPSQHQGLSNESTLRTRWPKYWSFSFNIKLVSALTSNYILHFHTPFKMRSLIKFRFLDGKSEDEWI